MLQTPPPPPGTDAPCVYLFSRNGVSMGAAFDGVSLGPGCAYFPAVSLSQGESVRLNFGAAPYMYPLSTRDELTTIESRQVGDDYRVSHGSATLWFTRKIHRENLVKKVIKHVI